MPESERMTGFLAILTPEQREFALSMTADLEVGDKRYRLPPKDE